MRFYHPGDIPTPAELNFATEKLKEASEVHRGAKRERIALWIWRVLVLAALLLFAIRSANAQIPPLNFDTSGFLQVNCQVGCSASSGPSFGAAFPSTGVAIGFNSNTNTLASGQLDSGGNLKVNCASGCSGAADTTASGNLTAGGNTVSIAMAGVNSGSFTLPSGNTLVATLTPEASTDGGTTWTATYLRNANAGFWALTLAASSTVGAFNILVPGGASNIRIRVSAYTSGSATAVVVRGVSQPEAVLISTGTPTNAAPPYALQVGGTDGANLRALNTDNTGKANVNAIESGTWTVQPGNTANTTPWLVTVQQGGNAATVTASNALKVDGSAVTQPVSGTVSVNALPTGSNTIGKVDILGNTGATLDSAPAATAPTNVLQVGGTFTTSPTTLTSGQAGALELDSAQNLLVNLKTAIPTGGNVIGAVTQSGTWTVQPGNTANTTPWLVQGNLSNNGAAAGTNRIGALDGIAQTSYNNGTATTQGRDVAANYGTDGLLWTAQLPAMRPASYTASSKFAASSTTDNTCMPGNASNTVLVTELRVSGIQTTAGILNAEIIKRSTADTAGTSANITAVPDDSNYAAAVSQPVSFTSTGPSVGTAVGDIDNAEIGFMATGTASPNDIYIANWRQKPIVLRGTAQEICVNMGNAAVTGGTMTVTWKWIETTTITP